MRSLFFGLHAPELAAAPALVDASRGHVCSYAELRDALASYGWLFRQAGVQRGDRFCVLHESRYEQAIAILAGLYHGLLVAPLDPAAPPAMLSRIIAHAAPKLLLSSPALPEPEGLPAHYSVVRVASSSELPRAPARLDEHTSHASNEGGLVIYTSGTTGSPKAVLLRSEAIEANVREAAARLGYQPGWRTGCMLPLFHTFGIVSDLLGALGCGGCAVILDLFSLHTIRAIVQDICTWKVRSYSGVPIMFEAFVTLRAGLTRSELEFVVAGAAPLSDELRLHYRAAFAHEIIPCYGLTETVCFACISPRSAIRTRSVGLPLVGMRVVDEVGAECEQGETGEFELRGPSVLAGGYFRDGGAHADAFTMDGWFRTGDLGHRDADGYVYITGRKKNMIIRGGEKVYLEDVDRALRAAPWVDDVVTVRIVNMEKGDRAVAFVVAPEMDEGHVRRQVCDLVSATLGPRSVPDEIRVLPSIPRTATGKPRYAELRSICGAPT